MSLSELARQLSQRLAVLAPQLDAGYVYDPTDYARESFECYLRRYAGGAKRVLLLGMNPGPWGMAQTGVPFGAVPWVKWLQVTGKIGRPAREHPRCAVQGLVCRRVEVSGDRLWGLLQRCYGTPAKLAADAVVLNYCPLLLLDTAQGRCRNLPLDRLTGSGRLLALCDEALAETLRMLAPEIAVGVGNWAHARLARVAPAAVAVGRMLHPSPASPAANRGFAGTARRQLQQLGAWPAPACDNSAASYRRPSSSKSQAI